MRTRLVSAALFVVVLPFLPCAPPALACTTAVISGKATADGRPLLWKNRDADDLHNQVVWREDGHYAFLGLVNQGDVMGLEVWAGVNETGFAIMNSASYNIEDGDTTDEGRLMRVALQSCASLADFERLLAGSDPVGRDVSANFGVIDAHGGAAYYETGKHGFRKFDANDAAAAPRGYIVRTNFSDSGSERAGSGFLRRERATGLIDGLVTGKRLAAGTLLSDVARDLFNARLGSDARRPRAAGGPAFAYVGDSLCREITSNAAVFAGVKPGEDPKLTTAWVILGLPITGAAVPLWPGARAVPAALAAGKEPAALNAVFDRVRQRLFPALRGEQKRYIAIDAVSAPQAGFAAPLVAIERENVEEAEAALARWRTTPPRPEDLAAMQEKLAARTLERVGALVSRTDPARP